jgi:signal transduction histidine kinase
VVAVAVAVAAAVTVGSFVLPTGNDVISAFLAFLAAYVAVGLHESRSRALAAGIVGYLLLFVISTNDPEGTGLDDVFAGAIFVFAPIAAGLAVRERTERTAELARRAEQLERLREEEARVAIAEERARITRELHDVIAQSIGAMTVQAGAARTLLRADPARARESIESVEATGREALAETRRLLGILRRDLSEPVLTPQPGLAALDRLVDSARRQGLPVELAVEGTPQPLAPGLDLAAYRVVQSGLAQAGERAGVTNVRLRLCWKADALEIEIEDDGRVATGAAADGPVELAAMRERLALYDGSIETTRGSDGVSSLRARLPLGSAP